MGKNKTFFIILFFVERSLLKMYHQNCAQNLETKVNTSGVHFVAEYVNTRNITLTYGHLIFNSSFLSIYDRRELFILLLRIAESSIKRIEVKRLETLMDTRRALLFLKTLYFIRETYPAFGMMF